MYYVINITKDENDIYKGETFMFPILCRVDDIVSGHLTLKSSDFKTVNRKKRDVFSEKRVKTPSKKSEKRANLFQKTRKNV